MWIEPRTVAGLGQGCLRGAPAKGNGKRERVMCAVLPGPLLVSGNLDVEGCEGVSEGAGCTCGSEELKTGESVPMQIQGMELNISGVVDDDDGGMGDCSAFDYDESQGRVVLASSHGRVLVLEV